MTMRRITPPPRQTTPLAGVLLLVAPAWAYADTAPYPISDQDRLMAANPETYMDAKLSGGPGKDGIPAIDEPVFWDVDEADAYLDDDDVVFGLVENGVVRAYPQRILVWHEIVNDTIDGEGVAVTYCPLTGTAIAFDRGDTEFGVSGRLVNSNLIMYDRDTNTWYPQILSRGISGPHSGASLEERPLVWTTWGDWREAYPDTEVLSTETGFARNYNRDPYGDYNPLSGYYAPDSDTMFPLMNTDDRHPNKEVVLGARTGTVAVAFHLDTLRDEGVATLETDEGLFTAVYDATLDTGYIFEGAAAGTPEVTGFGPESVAWSDGDGPEAVNAFEAMWFAWAAFYPETELYD